MKRSSQRSSLRFWLGTIAVALVLGASFPLSAEAQTNTFPSTGNVGIGTTSPSEQLTISSSSHVGLTIDPAAGSFDGSVIFKRGGINKWFIQSRNSGAPADAFTIYDAVNTAFRFTIDRSGKVGIGLTSPLYSLDVNGGVNGFRTKAATESSSDSIATFENSSGIQAIVRGNGNVGIGTVTPATKLHVAGGTRVDGTNGRVYLGTGAVTGARGLEFIEENATTFSIRHHDPNVAWQNIAISPHGGNVGIGTAVPSQKLHVFGGNIFHQFSATAGQEWGFYTSIRNNHFTSNLYFDGLWKMMAAGKGAVITTAPFEDTAFRVLADNTSRAANAPATFNSLMRITMDGKVGIGIEAPVHKLDVQGGAVNASGGFCIAGDCKTSWAQVSGGGSSQWTTSGTNIHYNGGNVGIGTADPAALLNVAGNNSTYSPTGNALLRIDNSSPTGQSPLDFFVNGSLRGRVRSDYGGNLSFVANGGDHYFLVGGDYNAGTPAMVVKAGGNVGIGTTAPNSNYKLDVNGHTNVTGNLNATGTITGGTINAKYQDVAEWVESSQALAAGTVVVLDHTRSNQVIASSSAYDTRVAGVISLQPGITLGENGAGKVLVATTGRVKIKVDATAGPIRIGDLLVTSDKAGIAKKSEPLSLGGVAIHRPGTLIGKALEPLAKGQGEILVLLSLQ
ncbi:MAG: hypothetical protein H7Z16_04005 [Pyrinomonadaceae bacterium]|nr:hypothetical protein [Pyrinomonadaceae bacterium]